MTLMKRASNVLFTVAAAGAVVGLAAAPAMAATTLTVKVTNGGTYTATASSTKLSDNSVSVTCKSTTTTKASTATGTVATASHTGTSPVTVGTAKTLNFKNCTGPLGAVTTSLSGFPYSIKVDSKTNSTGVTDGIITGVKAKVSMTGCSFTVSGSAAGSYSNSTHNLTMNPKPPITPLNKAQLTVANVSGCAGLVNNGDHPTFTGTYAVSRHFTIKSS